MRKLKQKETTTSNTKFSMRKWQQNKQKLRQIK